jgi:hypothetical protein
VLPNPVGGYAIGILEDAMDFGEGNYELVENTGRFGFFKALKRAGSLSAWQGRRVRSSTHTGKTRPALAR